MLQSYNCYEVKFIEYNHNVEDRFLAVFKIRQTNNCLSSKLTSKVFEVVHANVLGIKA